MQNKIIIKILIVFYVLFDCACHVAYSQPTDEPNGAKLLITYK
jgi:hypothetical protein